MLCPIHVAPSNWGSQKGNELCATGTSQSPINIVTDDAHEANLGPIRWLFIVLVAFFGNNYNSETRVLYFSVNYEVMKIFKFQSSKPQSQVFWTTGVLI